MRGLRVKPTYEQLVGVEFPDSLEHIKFPNRDASFLKNGFVLSQSDGEGMRAMEMRIGVLSEGLKLTMILPPSNRHYALNDRTIPFNERQNWY